MTFGRLILWFGLFVSSFSAYASEPKPWQLGFQDPSTPLMEGISSMHHYLLWIISFIGLFVVILLTTVILRFRESKNPKPSKVAHNVALEIVWTAVPAIIVVAIGIPSLKLLFEMDRTETADMTIKAIGNQWYWTYEYPDLNIKFDSNMVEAKDLKPGDRRLLEVDNRIMVPVGKTVRVLVTSQDVLHSFAVPSFGVKKDAVPGRTNETWFRVAKEGVYYGQCSELCGEKHGFMPIAVEVVPQDKYDAWVKAKAPPKEEPKKPVEAKVAADHKASKDHEAKVAADQKASKAHEAKVATDQKESKTHEAKVAADQKVSKDHEAKVAAASDHRSVQPVKDEGKTKDAIAHDDDIHVTTAELVEGEAKSDPKTAIEPKAPTETPGTETKK